MRTLTLFDDRKIGATFTEEALVAISNLKIGKIVIVFLRTEKAEEHETLSKVVAANDAITENWNVKFAGNELTLVRRHKTDLQITNTYRVTRPAKTREEKNKQIENTIKRAMRKPSKVVNSPVLLSHGYLHLKDNIGLESKYR